MNNILRIPELPLQAELVQDLLKRDNIRIERIVSDGQITGWLDQEQAEWVLLLVGTATIEYQNGHLLNMQAGDYVYLPPHEIHRVAYTSSDPACIWLCFFWEVS